MNKLIPVLAITAMMFFQVLCIGTVKAGGTGVYWPGAEGLDSGVRGYQFGANEPGEYIHSYFGTEQAFPTNGNPYYQWTQQPVDIYNTGIKKVKTLLGMVTSHMTITAERQTPTRDELSAGRKIEYYVPYGNGSSLKIVGTVVPWVFNIQLYIVPGASAKNDWPEFMDGEAFWFGLGTKKWDRAYSDPDNIWKSSFAGYSVPLCVYIESFSQNPWKKDDQVTQQTPKQEWVTESCQLSPSESGRTVTLYSSPTGTGTLDDLWYQGGLDTQGINNALNAINSSIAPDPNPDSRFSNHCYFRVTMNMFKPYVETDFWGNKAYWYPSVYFRLRCYFLELGEFIYTQSESDLPWWDVRSWGKVFGPFTELWAGILAGLNPFAIFGPWGGFVAFLFTLGIIAIVIVVLLAIFAPGVLARGSKGLKEGVSDVWLNPNKKKG